MKKQISLDELVRAVQDSVPSDEVVAVLHHIFRTGRVQLVAPPTRPSVKVFPERRSA